MRTLITRLAIVATLAAGLAATGTTYGAQAAPATCQGEPATIVGSPGGHFHGTDHRDVIVTDGASGHARGGNDLICITGELFDSAHVDAGPGRDVVDASAMSDTGRRTFVVLGTGADRFRGGVGDDIVTTGGPGHSRDTAHDVVMTGRGRDHVSTGTRGQRDDDTVQTGADLDSVKIFGIPDGARINAGNDHERDRLTPYVGTPRGHVSLDVTRGVMRIDGRQVLRARGFDNLTFVYPPTDGLTIRRGRGCQVHLVNDLSSAPVTYDVDIQLKGRSAALDADPSVRVHGRAVAGTQGALRITGHAVSRTTVDLDGWMTEDGRRVLNLSGFAYVLWESVRPDVRATFLGSDLDESVRFTDATGRVVMRGRGGDDWLESGNGPAVLHGGSGSDKLVSHDGHDHLYGGPGHDGLFSGRHSDVLRGGRGPDTLNGQGGQDRCSEEPGPRKGCELPLS